MQVVPDDKEVEEVPDHTQVPQQHETDLEANIAVEEDDNTKFRRQSIDLGIYQPPRVAPLLLTSQLKQLTDSQISSIADSLIMSIKSSSGIGRAVDSWAADELPEAEGGEAKEVIMFMKRVVHALAKKIVTWLKMARIGLTVRIFVALVLTYEDITTDILVSIEYKETGREGFFRASMGILVVAILLHCTIAWMDSKKKEPNQRIRRLAIALSLMTPIVDAYNVWTGKEADHDLQFTPEEALVISRIIELVFESLPESVLQVYILLNTDREDVSSLMVVSILASLSAAAFIMCDSSISYEREYMTSIDGPHVHPVFGYIPVEKRKQIGLYVGMFSFFMGNFASNVLAYTNMAMHFPPVVIPVLLPMEIGLYFFIQRRRGLSIYWHAPLGNEKLSSFIVNLCYYLLTAILPWTQLRVPVCNGPALFAFIIIYTNLKNTLINIYAVTVSSGETQETQRAALIVSVVLVMFGIFFTLLNSHAEHRRTFYTFERSLNGKYFDFDSSMSGNNTFYKTRDEAMGRLSCLYHPELHRRVQLLEWVLSIDVDKSSIFQSGKNLPRSVTGVSQDTPHSFLFAKLRAIFAYYEDEEAAALVEEKLSSLEDSLAKKIEEEERMMRTPTFTTEVIHRTARS